MQNTTDMLKRDALTRASSTLRTTAWRPVIRLVAIYALVSCAWIWWSDRLVRTFIKDPRANLLAQTYKGWLFVAVSGFLIGWLMRRAFKKIEQVEIGLRQSEERLRATLENTPNVSVQWYDAEGRVLFWNRASERIFGWRANQALGKTLDQFLLSPEDAAAFNETLRRVGKTGQIEGPKEYQVKRSDGNWSYCLSTVFAIPSPDGNHWFVCMDVDLTEQKRAEQALRHLTARVLGLQDEERRRLARELHDTTAQGLAALTMNLSLLQRADPNQREKIERIIAESLALAERSAQEIRTFSYLLHPPVLDEMGLPGAIREFAAGFARRSGIEVDVQAVSEVGRLPQEIELHLFRIVQESLGNIHRHSGSGIARICLARSKNAITLQVQDTGRGISAEKIPQITGLGGGLGVGVPGMRERLHELGGQLEIESGPGGTTVCATVPWSEASG